jgi:phage gp45-like
MNWIATLLKLGRGEVKTVGNAPGPSVAMQGEGMEGQTMTAEVYQAPGVLAVPPDGVRGVWLPIGGSSRYGVVVACQNYQITLDVGGPGGTAIYSTSADGKTVKASLVLGPDGMITAKNETQNLAALMTELLDKILAIQTVGPPPQHTLGPTSVTDFGALKTKFQQLLKE